MQTTLEPEILERNLEDDRVPCQGAGHPIGYDGHVPEAYAEFRIVTPCCKASISQCRGRVGRLLAEERIRCGVCTAAFFTIDMGVFKL